MKNDEDSPIQRIMEPSRFFNDSPEKFYDVVKAVRDAFGTYMTEEDIHNHLMEPNKVYLFQEDSRVFGMGGYSRKRINDCDILFVDGVAIGSQMQGKGLFGQLTDIAREKESYVALKTQNPRMYRALQKYCSETYPNEFLEFPEEINFLMNGLARDINLSIDEKMVARRFYGKSLYPSKMENSHTDKLFNDILRMNYIEGDSVLCLGKV